MLILSSGYRQVTIHVNKQEQFTPYLDVNLLNCLLPRVKYWRYLTRENKSRKLKLY